MLLSTQVPPTPPHATAPGHPRARPGSAHAVAAPAPLVAAWGKTCKTQMCGANGEPKWEPKGKPKERGERKVCGKPFQVGSKTSVGTQGVQEEFTDVWLWRVWSPTFSYMGCDLHRAPTGGFQGA